MIITLGGKAGSGKGTVAKLLAEKLGYQIIWIWAMKRQLAEEMGLSISEFNQLGEKPENQKAFDLKYEEFQKNLDLKENIILDSRLGFLCQPHAFKIFLDIEDTIAAKRIWEDRRTTDNFWTFEETLDTTQNRNQEDRQRFIKLYDIDIYDPNHYDLMVNTSNLSPDEVFEIILNAFNQWQQKKE